jgi:mRNA interferase HigB
MRIVSHRRIVEFYSSEGHGDSQAALERWYDMAKNAECEYDKIDASTI